MRKFAESKLNKSINALRKNYKALREITFLDRQCSALLDQVEGHLSELEEVIDEEGESRIIGEATNNNDISVDRWPRRVR